MLDIKERSNPLCKQVGDAGSSGRINDAGALNLSNFQDQEYENCSRIFTLGPEFASKNREIPIAINKMAFILH